MQAIDIAAYKRLGDSYAEENGGLLEKSEEQPGSVKRIKNRNREGNPCVKNGYEQLAGNSDSEDGYQTAADTEDEDRHRSYVDSTETGYQRSAEHDGKGSHHSSSKEHQSGTHGGYQSLSDMQYPGYQRCLTQDCNTASEKTWLTPNDQMEVADESGYFRLEGFSEFCGNIKNMRSTDIKNGYSAFVTDKEIETKKLSEDPPEMLVEEVKIEPTPVMCSFRVLVKMVQMTFCLLAMICSFFARSWLTTAIGVWFLLVNTICAGVASSVVLAIIYNRIDHFVLCKRKVVQLVYLTMLPMLLSAGLLGASVATSSRYRLEFEKTMIMVASMLTLMGLFAMIGDVVMNRRTWSMFRMVGGNAYIHAAFMA